MQTRSLHKQSKTNDQRELKRVFAPRPQLVRVGSPPARSRGWLAAELPSSYSLPFLFCGLLRLCWNPKAEEKGWEGSALKCLK